MNIFLLRHPAVVAPSGLCYGQSDLDLQEGWQPETKNIFDALPVRPERIVYSPLVRCKQVALYLSEYTKIDAIPEKNMMEVSFGEWENKTWNNIDRASSQAWMDNFVFGSPPGGESLMDLYGRTTNCLDRLATEQHEIKSMLIISHAGPIRCMLAWALGLELNQIFRIEIGTGQASGIWYDTRAACRKVLFINK